MNVLYQSTRYAIFSRFIFIHIVQFRSQNINVFIFNYKNNVSIQKYRTSDVINRRKSQLM